MEERIGLLETEIRNPRTLNLDKMTSLEMVEAIINEEKRVVPAALSAKHELAKAVDLYASVLMNNGRIINTGSGCSGDYGATDVMELDATFGQKAYGDKNTDKVMSLHIQRGWYFEVTRHDLLDQWVKMIKDRDISEDSLTQPVKDLDYIKFGKEDLLIAITASGRSPAIVKLAMEAKSRGGKVISIVHNNDSEIAKYSDVTILAPIGQPPLAGSGRTIAGTTSKIIITTLSTAAHVKAGAVYSNLMVNLNVKKWLDNSKFVDRASRIVADIIGVAFDDAKTLLKNSDWNIKVACVMFIKNVTKNQAKKLLREAKGILRSVIG